MKGAPDFTGHESRIAHPRPRYPNPGGRVAAVHGREGEHDEPDRKGDSRNQEQATNRRMSLEECRNRSRTTWFGRLLHFYPTSSYKFRLFKMKIARLIDTLFALLLQSFNQR
jgi:hypothetical protein